MRKYRSSSNLVKVRWFLAELCPFYIENNMKFSVSVHYLPNDTRYSTQTWHMDMSWENTVHVRIWSWFDDFWQSYAPFTLKIIWNFQFPFIISLTVQHIQLKLDIWICFWNAQAKFEFVMVQWFLAELCPFHFENNMKFTVSVHYVPNSVTIIQLKFDIWIC
jgi:hypothetical protein